MKTCKDIGAILKEAREKKGLTIERVCSATRMQSSMVEALEEGRADELLSRIYVLLFLKKYAFFLDLDGINLVTEYKSFYADQEKQILDLKKASKMPGIDSRKWMTFAIFAGLAIICVFLILFLGIKLKSPGRTKEKAHQAETTKPVDRSAIKPATKAKIFPIPKNKPIKLLLRSNENVWMRVKSDGKTVFVGTIKKNAEKEWVAKNNLELWVGKAEALRFTINGKHIGKISEGIIKDIRISRHGLEAGNKWLFKAK